MVYEQILYEVQDDVALITLNRPERRNAWTPRMDLEKYDALVKANDDPAVGAIVITGAGKGFCAGADMQAFDAQLAGGGRPETGGDWTALVRASKPMVAAVNGASVGVGLTMILCCDVIVASEQAVEKYGLTPLARVLGGATGGVAPRVMGLGPIPATRKLCARLGLKPTDFDVVELNEAFASQGIAVLRELGIAEDGAHVNPNGGAIALGHPLGMSGARITGTAALELSLSGRKRALATMCIGVGQGIAVSLERA